MMDRFILPFKGIPTFCQVPYQENLDNIRTEVAVFGVPWDEGVGFIPGQRFGPKQIRDFSCRYRIPKEGFFISEDKPHVLRNLKMADFGDIVTLKTLPEKTFKRITETIRKILSQNIFPIALGGDHSVTYPLIRGFSKYKRLGVIQIDAHLDFDAGREGVVLGNECTLRRISELRFVKDIIQLGTRGLKASGEIYFSAKERGNIIYTTQEIRQNSANEILKRLPNLEVDGVYLTVDMDVLDPSIAPGVTTREINGLTYEETRQLISGLTSRYPIVGLDVVEVNPLIDPSGITAIVATRLILDFLISHYDR